MENFIMEMIPYSNIEIIQPSEIIQAGKNLQKSFDRNYFQLFYDYTDVKDTTLKGYMVCIKSFENWMKQTGVRNPDRADIMDYKTFLSDQCYSAGTQRQYLRAVKHFFKWAAAEGLYQNVADNIKGAKVKQDNTRKDPFTDEEILAVIRSIDTSTITGKRNKAMIILAVSCGLRIIELQRADIGDIEMKNGRRVIYIQRKGHDEKDVYKKVEPEAWEAIEDYLNTRPEAGKKDPLFASTSNRSKSDAKGTESKTKWTKQKSENERLRISEPTFSTIIKDVFRKAGFDSKRLTAHSLRHSAITYFLEETHDLQGAQMFADHCDPKTTTIYAHNIDKDKQNPERIILDHIFKKNGSCKDKLSSIISGMSENEAEKLLSFLQK